MIVLPGCIDEDCRGGGEPHRETPRTVVLGTQIIGQQQADFLAEMLAKLQRIEPEKAAKQPDCGGVAGHIYNRFGTRPVARASASRRSRRRASVTATLRPKSVMR